MEDVLSYFKTINQMNWGDSAYQWLFYLSLLLILLFEKKKYVKRVFGWLPVLFLAAIFNPVFYHLFFSILYSPAYYARMFSFIPLMYSIALGFTRLIGKTRGWKKCAGVIAICIVLIFTGNNIYEQDWMQFAQTPDKAPQETYEILNALNNDGDSLTSIAAIDVPSVYIRQIGDVITPYTRYADELGNALAQDSPNVRWVMELAGRKGLDYVVTHNTETTQDAFAAEGYAPYATLNNYLIYKVENVSHIHSTLNEKRQIASVSYYDEKGDPAPSNPNYRSSTTIAYEYDDNGFRTKEIYLDSEGNPFYTNSGYSTVIRRNSSTGLLKSLLYCDENEQPVLISGRFETRFKNDLYGRVTCESYYDENGKLMNRKDTGHASQEYRYTGKDRLPSLIRYFDKNGQPVICAFGYAGVSREYDDQQRIIRETYLNSDGEPMLLQAGYASLLREYSDDGMSYTETYIDTEGKNVQKYGGYASAEYHRQEDETITDVKFRNQEGEPVVFALDSFSLGATNTGEDVYRLETNIEGNSFNCMQIVLWDINNRSWVHVVTKERIGISEGEYLHEGESGYYKLTFKANGNKRDESIDYIVYLEKGERYYYHFNVYMLSPQLIETSGVIWE